MLPFQKMTSPRLAYFKMHGTAVFESPPTSGAEIILQLSRSRRRLQDIDWFICHQANINIIETIADRLSVSREKFGVNVDRYAKHLPALPVLVALDEAIQTILCAKATWSRPPSGGAVLGSRIYSDIGLIACSHIFKKEEE